MLVRLKFLTSGESHGKGLLGILDGIPAGLEISEQYIGYQLKRRQMGYGRGGRMKIEKDWAEVWSGVRHGVTLGSPIGLLIENKDWVNWEQRMSAAPIKKEIKKITLPRPGHADLAGLQKFGFDDIRNVLERSSARETTMRVALGSVCRKLLEEFGIEIGSRVTHIHNIVDSSSFDKKISPVELSKIVDKSPVRCIDKNAEKKMVSAIDEAKANGDSVGGIFEIIATGCPYGLGSPFQWDRKLQAKISAMMMSVNAFKSIEIGRGSGNAVKFGSEIHDEIGWDGNKFIRFSNNAGGIEGGMSNTEPIVIRLSMKPIATLTKALRSVDFITKEKKSAHKERTDSCAVPAASIIAESMLCFVLADAILEKFGGDSISQIKAHLESTGKY